MSINDKKYRTSVRNKEKDYEIADCKNRIKILNEEANNYGSDLDKNLKNNHKKCSSVSADKLIFTVEQIYKEQKNLNLLKMQAGWIYECGKFIKPDDNSFLSIGGGIGYRIVGDIGA